MENRKNPKSDMNRFSTLFSTIGLLVSLLLVVSAFEWRTEQKEPPIDIPDPIDGMGMEIVKITTIEDPKPPKPKKQINIVPVADDLPEEPPFDFKDLLDDDYEPTIFVAPEPPAVEVYKGDPVDYAEVMPLPEGGYEAFYAYIAKNLKYPRRAVQIGVEGKVYVSFVVDEQGNVSNVAIAKGIGAGCDEESVRVMENAPKWTPGQMSGRKVKVKMIVPIHFKLK